MKKDPQLLPLLRLRQRAGEGTKRVSKESQIGALKAAIEAKGGTVDEHYV